MDINYKIPRINTMLYTYLYHEYKKLKAIFQETCYTICIICTY